MREHGEKSFDPHLLVNLAFKIFIVSWAMSHPATYPNRAASRTVSGSTGTLLFPRLFASTRHLTSVFGMSNWGASIAHHSHPHLMHQSFGASIPRQTKDFFWKLYAPGLLSCLVINFGFHDFILSIQL